MKTLDGAFKRAASSAGFERNAPLRGPCRPEHAGIPGLFRNGSSDYERIGDHAKNLMELREYMTDHELAFSPQAMSEFDGMLTLVRQMVEKSTQALNGENLDLAHEVAGVLEERTDAMEKSLRHLHIQRLNEGLCAPASGVIFIDIITNLERIGDHATNVAEIILAMHGEKTGAEVPGSY